MKPNGKPPVAGVGCQSTHLAPRRSSQQTMSRVLQPKNRQVSLVYRCWNFAGKVSFSLTFGDPRRAFQAAMLTRHAVAATGDRAGEPHAQAAQEPRGTGRPKSPTAISADLQDLKPKPLLRSALSFPDFSHRRNHPASPSQVHAGRRPVEATFQFVPFLSEARHGGIGQGLFVRFVELGSHTEG